VSERRWLEGDDDPAAIELRRALDEARLGTPDDVTLRRMWGRVAEPRPLRPRRAPRWLWFSSGVVSTAAAAVAIAGWMAHHHRAPALAPAPALAASRAPVSPPSAPATVPESGPHVVAPGTVRNGGQETLVLTLRGGVEARLGSASVMSLDANERPTVEDGDVGFQVPHQKPGHTFVVRAGKYHVVVVGTRFHLRVDERRRVFVSVEEGTVEVWDRARLAELAPGDSWGSAASDDSGEAEAAQRTPATRAARREPRAHTVALSTPSAPTREAASAGASDGAATAAAAITPTPAPAVSPALPTAELVAQARAAATAGDGTRALALYRALALRDGPAGENAEYEIGKLLRDRMGQPMAAVAAWRHYRTEHPNGLLRVEADVSIVEALVHAGEPDAALAEANEFLRRFPSSERRPEIARVAGDLLRARGDCARAVAAYETALAAPRAASVAEAATFHRASCLVQLGDAGGAEAARAYLRAWPNGRFRDQAAQLAAVGRSDGEGRSRP
jgi:hypothetical protein